MDPLAASRGPAREQVPEGLAFWTQSESAGPLPPKLSSNIRVKDSQAACASGPTWQRIWVSGLVGVQGFLPGILAGDGGLTLQSQVPVALGKVCGT